MKKLSPDAVFQTADEIFFLFMEYLSDSERDEFFIDDDENKGTMNTERGQHLFNGDDNKHLLFICSHVIGILTERI